jgi:lipoprotein-anchoring transpeptidase ErfK/SrfK
MALIVSASSVLSLPALAQWSNYDGYQYAPPPPPPRAASPAYPPYPAYSPYGQDPYAPAYAEPRARPYVRSEPSPYGDPDSNAYPPRGGSPASVQQTNPELGVDASARTMQIVSNPTHEPAGTIVVDTRSKHLYFVQGDGQAVEYGIGVGREGFEWKGEAHVQRKAEWPDWYPPKDMLKRRPDLPEHMDGGIENPLGARALYLYKGNKDTMFRIHGTNEPDTIGKAVSSGCIRMMNGDVEDLYKRVPVGTRVVVL